MRNVWLIFRRDASNLFRNVMSTIITVGLVLLPSLFAWYNILACWNVFDNTGNLSVAVANDDEGFTSDLIPVELNVGEKIEAALHKNDQINWVFTSSDDAIEGTKAGRYYAALVIPDDFSRQMLTFYKRNPDSIEISYYVNEKVNAISPNIIGTGADTVSYEVNAAFAETVSEISAGLAKSLAEHAGDSGIGDQIAKLTDRMRDIAQRADETSEVLGLYSSLASDSQALLASSADLVESARQQAKGAVDGREGDRASLREVAERLDASTEGLAETFDRNAELLQTLEEQADSLLAVASQDASTIAERLRGEAADIDAQVEDMSTRLADLQQLRDDLHSGVGTEVDTIVSGDIADVEITREVEVIAERTVLLDKAISALSQAIGILQEASGGLTDAASGIESGDVDVEGKVAALLESAEKAKADLDAMRDDFVAGLEPGIEALRGDLDVLVSDLDAAAEKLDGAGADLPNAAGAVGSALDKTANKVDAARDKLGSAASEMRRIADAIDTALAAGDDETLRSLLTGDISDLAGALSSPVQVKREAIFPADGFGSAMAPLYCALALFIGSLLIMVALKPEVSQRGRALLHDPKPRQLYLGRFGVVALISLMQTTVLGLGSMLLLKVQVSDPVLFMACFWISGLVFAFMIYTLVVSFGNLGKGIAVLLLIVQVTGCGGSYPLPIMPDFVQTISPFLPARYVVDALRAAMFGVYQNDFWISMGTLLLFTAPFLLLGLVLRKPLERFMRFYVRKAEESGVVE